MELAFEQLIDRRRLNYLFESAIIYFNCPEFP